MGPGLDRRAPLFLASTFNKLASLECLIRHGADLRTTNEECSGATCLSVAAERNNALVIRALAAAGAPLQQVMHDGASPLHLACFNLSVEATRGVCGREADANFHTHLQPPHTTLNRPRHTPSHSNYTRLPPTSSQRCLSSAPTQTRSTRWGPRQYTSCSAPRHARQPPLRWCRLQRCSRMREQTSMRPPATRPSRLPTWPWSKASSTSSVRHPSSESDTPPSTWQHAILRPRSLCYLPTYFRPFVTGVLFDAGAKINVRANGQTLLSRAIYNGHDAIIDDLLERGADLDQATSEGASPLFLAAGMGNTSLVRRLHAAGAAVDTAVDTNGNSALEYAARLGKLASVELLIELNADIFTTDKQGANVAFGTIASNIFASFEEHEACVRLLHARGLDFSAADNDGWTPAHAVVQQLNVYALRLLHDLGVPLNVASVITKGNVTCRVTGQPMLDPSGEPLTVPPGTEEMAITPADMAVGPMLLELCNLGVIEEAEVRRRLQASGEIYLLEHYNQLRAAARAE